MDIEQVIALFPSKSALARTVGVSKQAVSQWRSVPEKHVLAIERATGVSRHELNREAFPPWPEDPYCGCPYCQRRRAEAEAGKRARGRRAPDARQPESCPARCRACAVTISPLAERAVMAMSFRRSAHIAPSRRP